MKKVTYVIMLMFSLVLLSTSCEKDEPIVPEEPELTLEERYPEWSNLTWVSTDGIDAVADPNIYPRLNIKIVGDVATINLIEDVGTGGTPYFLPFESLEISDGNAIFLQFPEGGYKQIFNILTPPDSTKMKLSRNDHTYVLQIN